MILSRRSLAALAALAAVVALPLGAQSRRVSLTPFVGQARTSTLFSHWFFEMAPTPRGDEVFGRGRRLTLDAATSMGARLELGTGAWTGWAEGAFARARASYVELVAVPAGIDESSANRVSPLQPRATDGSIAALSAGASRRVTIPATRERVSLAASAGAGLRRIALARPDAERGCEPGPSSRSCVPEPWDARYHVPEVLGALALRARITGALALEARGTAATGWANTRDFGAQVAQREGVPTFEEEPRGPSRQRLRSTLLSLGLSYTR